VLGVLLLATAFGFPNAPQGDRIICPGSPSAGASPITDERFAKLTPVWADNLRLHSTPTTRSDGVIFPVPVAPWYQPPAGGKADGENAAYDVAHGVMFSCARYDTAMGFAAWLVPPLDVPSYVARVSVKQPFKTAAGIGFGASPESVRKLYGSAPLQAAGGDLMGLQYEKRDEKVGNLHYAVDTTFVFRDGKLVGIYRVAGI
jgi:hypothetical protein